MRFDEFEKAMDKIEGLQPAVLIEHGEEGRGVAIRIGENLAETWQSGDVIVFWPNGDHTTIHPDHEILVVKMDLYADGEDQCSLCGGPKDNRIGWLMMEVGPEGGSLTESPKAKKTRSVCPDCQRRIKG
jgi:hypothetical protein